ncbi:anti-FlhDC factor YdiV [Salmonella enterica subsp. salamae]|nr:anti-FlhDC factor YdiV [Salmonella enterica subsp. salamae]ECJ2280129.1 anti-FlhDC factor YdiV [Salmonella enterica subsp. salamae]HCC0886864.1 anti-FlhDC factor YdiV [Salmonella enterica]
MIVSLDELYHSELFFLPAMDKNARLVGLEIIATFVTEDGAARMPTELAARRLSVEEQCCLFVEKLALLETCQHFFIQHKIIAWINISPAVSELLVDSELFSQASRFPFLELAINENYPGLNQGKENETLAKLAIHFPLILANFGAGEASTKAIFDGLFKRIVLDKSFIQQWGNRLSFEPFMRAIVFQLSSSCESLMIAGMDSKAIFARAAPLGFSAFQGGLWPPVPVSQLMTLIQR